MNRSIGLITALFTAACFAPAASADHKPGHQGGGGGGNAGNPSLRASPNPVLSGRTLTLTGKLTGANNSGQQVTLRSDPFPFGVFGNVVATATTDANGDFTFTQKPTLNTNYVARRGGDESSPVTVAVQPRVGLRLSDYTPRRGQSVRFFGRVCPQHNGSTVAIQRRFSTGYRTVRRATLRAIPGSGCSSWTRTFRVRRSSRYRTVIGAHADHIRGVSRTRVARVS